MHIGVVVIKESFMAPKLPKYRGYIDCQDGTSSTTECEFLDVGKLQKCAIDKDTGIICQGIVGLLFLMYY